MRYLLLFAFAILTIITRAQVDISIATVKCDADTTQSYAVYLPAQYSKTQRFPVIFLFDPAARGRYAASLFKEAADEVGMVVLASNNSRNGPMVSSLQAANNMFADAFKKYNLDQGQIYLAGFSGGARVATTIALSNPTIVGVIACSAGFGEPIPPSKLPWNFIGTIGTKDFNHVEMQQVHKTLDAQQSTNTLIIFNGPHSWPPKEAIKEALLLSILYHRKAALTADDALLLKYRQLVLDQIAINPSALAKAAMYERLLTVFEDPVARQKYEEVKKQPQYQTEAVLYQHLYESELSFQNDAGSALQFILYKQADSTKPQSWWWGKQNEFKKLLTTGIKADSDYVSRQRSFLSANISEEFESFYNAGKYGVADELLQIETIFDATDPMIAYRYARLSAAKQDEDATLNYLEEAVKKGLKNKAMISNEKAFYFLRTNKRFKALIN